MCTARWSQHPASRRWRPGMETMTLRHYPRRVKRRDRRYARLGSARLVGVRGPLEPAIPERGRSWQRLLSANRASVKGTIAAHCRRILAVSGLGRIRPEFQRNGLALLLGQPFPNVPCCECGTARGATAATGKIARMPSPRRTTATVGRIGTVSDKPRVLRVTSRPVRQPQWRAIIRSTDPRTRGGRGCWRSG